MSIQHNYNYWNSHSHKYPFHAKQVKNPAINPETLGDTPHLRVPFAACVMWGFETEEARDQFVARYPGRFAGV